VPPDFGYLLARSDDLRSFAIQQLTGTSSRQRVRPESLRGFRLALPPDDVAVRSGELVRTMFEKIRHNTVQAKTLATLLDTLLPKLLSGELRVRDVA
jgi:type I restriction enzyme S subunit